MLRFTQTRLVRQLLALGTLVALVLCTPTAWAYGRVQWTSTRVKEQKAGTQSSWKLEITIHLNKAPDFAHVPVKFEFKQQVYYERFLADETGDKPQIRNVPMPNAQEIIEGAELGFLDPGTGTIQSRTRFGFRITRAHGFEAGEYSVVIKDARNGAVIGNTTKLILEGENEIIDRRSMVFAGKGDEDEKSKKEEGSKEEGEGEEEGGEDRTGEGAMDANPADDPDNWPEVEHEQPQEIEEKPGGCKCRVAGDGGTAPGALLFLAGTTLLVARRRRRAA